MNPHFPKGQPAPPRGTLVDTDEALLALIHPGAACRVVEKRLDYLPLAAREVPILLVWKCQTPPKCKCRIQPPKMAGIHFSCNLGGDKKNSMPSTGGRPKKIFHQQLVLSFVNNRPPPNVGLPNPAQRRIIENGFENPQQTSEV